MFDLKSDLNLCNRFEVTAATAIADAAARQGSWVTLAGALSAADNGRGAFMVWSESKRDGTAGWTPDVVDTGQVTVLSGYFIGYTTQFDNTDAIAVGDLLVADADGKLIKATSAADATDNQATAVALALGVAADHKYVGGTYSSIKIMSL